MKYINILPSISDLHNLPFHWNESKLSSFPYKHLLNSVRNQKKKWNNIYSSISSLRIKFNESFDISFEVFSILCIKLLFVHFYINFIIKIEIYLGNVNSFFSFF